MRIMQQNNENRNSDNCAGLLTAKGLSMVGSPNGLSSNLDIIYDITPFFEAFSSITHNKARVFPYILSSK